MPDAIAVLIPTRERPELIQLAIESAFATASEPEALEFRLWVEDDDEATRALFTDWQPERVHVHMGDDRPLGQRWTDLAFMTSAPLVLLCADHVIFRTPGWDARYREAFECWPDRIGVVHASDGFQMGGLASLAMVHRRWLERLGYFTPTLFRCWYGDTWLTEVADLLGRRVYLPDVLIETLSPEAGKREADAVFLRKRTWLEQFHEQELFALTRPHREADAERLRALMDEQAPSTPRTIGAITITKDEELDRLSASLDGAVDEWTLVATGERYAWPDWPELRRSPDRLTSFPWCDDFAAARNASIEAARADYLIWLDSDDELVEAEPGALRAAVQELPPGTVGLIRCASVGMEGSTDGPPQWTGWQQRIFARLPGVHFEGRVHEQLMGTPRQAVQIEDVWVRHHGYADPAVLRQKGRRNLRLLRLALGDESGSPFQRYNLARQLASLHRWALAARHIDRALTEWQAAGQPGGDYVGEMLALAVQLALAVGDPHKAVTVATHAPERHYTPDLLVHAGLAWRDIGAYLEAGWCFREAASGRHHTMGGDPANATWRPLLGLALLAGEQGRERQAAHWREKALLAAASTHEEERVWQALRALQGGEAERRAA